MDNVNVMEKLVTALVIDEDVTGTTNFDGLYKNWGRLDNQEQRRNEMLVVQKGNRNTLTDKFRGILGLVEAVEGSDIFQEKKALYKPKIYVAGFHRCAYNNVLMLSEWMIEKPADFDQNWYVVPCPKGVRTLVVASQGITKCFTKQGHFRLECPTALPGGSHALPGYNTRCCILDCFYVEISNTMYVLDILAWNNQPMTDGETEFRHFWMVSHLNDIPGLGTLSKKNKLIFKILPKVPCDQKNFDEFMMKIPHFPNYTPKLDGLLFYHKKAHYFAGQTPLVGWLYPFMVPEVLGQDVKINPGYIIERPANYTNQADFIKKFEEKSVSKKKSKKIHVERMDTSVGVIQKTKETLTEEKHMEADVPADEQTNASADAQANASADTQTNTEQMTVEEKTVDSEEKIIDSEEKTVDSEEKKVDTEENTVKME